MDCFSDPKVERVVIQKPAQSGGATTLDTPIATPLGWTTMGKVKVGNVVFSIDGTLTRVLSKSKVLKNLDCFEVEFETGMKITVDGSHRWFVNPTVHAKGKGSKGVHWADGKRFGVRSKPQSGVYTTKKLFETQYDTYEGTPLWTVPVAKALDLPEIELPIDPYVLGTWLGDGTAKSNAVTTHKDEIATWRDEYRKGGWLLESYDKPQIRGQAETLRIHPLDDGPPFVTRLRWLDLFQNKHIPPLYMRGSKEQRLALLQGLIDSDGTISNGKRDNRATFSQKSRKMCEGVFELAISLGLKPRIIKKNYKPGAYGGDGKAFGVTMVSYRDILPLSRLPRKINNLGYSWNSYTRATGRRKIMSIRRVPSIPVQCIEVDHPSHLYLVGREMIPTHNTQALFNMAGWIIDHAPAPTLWMQTTASFAQSFAKSRFSAFLAGNPRLGEKVDKAGSKIDEKYFSGGFIAFVGSKAAGPLRARPIQYLIMDDVDGFLPTTGEGDPIKLARERLKTYRAIGTSKEVMCSSPAPSTKNPLGYSRIAREYKGSDQRRQVVPCRQCEAEQLLEWERVAWNQETEDPASAYYVCDKNGCIWSEADRKWSIQRGRWVALNPYPEDYKGRIVAGFQFSELDTPFSSLEILVKTWLSAVGKENEEEVFFTANLGRTVEYVAEKLDPDRLYERREKYERGIVPKRAAKVSVGVDVQGDRLEASIVAWGRGLECWLVDHLVIPGKPEEKATWDALEEEVIFKEWDHAGGGRIQADAVCVDSGSYTSLIYQWKRGLRGDGGRVRLTKGMDNWDAMLPNVVRRDVHWSGKKLPMGIQPWNLGVSFAKVELVRWLGKNGPDNPEEDWTPNYVHFPEFGREYFKQLCAEELRIEKDLRGHDRKLWYQMGPNETLDCWIMARAGADMCGWTRASEEWWRSQERGGKEEEAREARAVAPVAPVRALRAHAGPAVPRSGRARMPSGGRAQMPSR